MAELVRRSKKLGISGIGSVAVAAVVVGLGSGTASADVEDWAPDTGVKSRQAEVISRDAVREDATHGEVRTARDGVVRGHGEVRDSAVAVPGNKSSGFRPGWGTRPFTNGW